MQKYIKNYLKSRGLDTCDFIKCELCGRQGVDVHHINGRVGKNAHCGSNLICLCRQCHTNIHNNNTKETKKDLENIVNLIIN